MKTISAKNPVKNRKALKDLLYIDIIKEEIKYAKSQLQPHDTGHIHTAISWMQHRLNQLEGKENDS